MAVAFKITICDHCEGTNFNSHGEWVLWCSGLGVLVVKCGFVSNVLLQSHGQFLWKQKLLGHVRDEKRPTLKRQLETRLVRPNAAAVTHVAWGWNTNCRAHGATWAWITTHFILSLNAAKNITMAFKCLKWIRIKVVRVDFLKENRKSAHSWTALNLIWMKLSHCSGPCMSLGRNLWIMATDGHVKEHVVEVVNQTRKYKKFWQTDEQTDRKTEK